MSKIYEEALLDAKKIRDAAEQAAKDRIMESITPQIRQMINNRILFEQDELDPFEDDAEPEAAPDAQPADGGLDFDSIVDNMPDVDVGDDMMDAAADAAISVYAAGDVNIDLEQGDDDDEEEGLMTDLALSEAFAKLIRSDFAVDKGLARRIERLSERTEKLSAVLSVLSESKISNAKQRRLELGFISLVKEGVSLQHELKHSGRGSQRLEQKLNSTIKEMREMSSKYKRNIFDFLFEAEEDTKKKVEAMHEQDEAEAEEVEVEAADVDVDAASDALEDLGAALGLELEIEEEAGGEAEVEEEEEEEEELDLDEADVNEMMREMMREDDHNEGEKHEEADMDEVYEVNETALRRELARMRRARRLHEEAEEEADQFGGGEVLGDVIEIDEDTLLNVLADELGSVGETGGGGDTVAESRRRRQSRATRKALREAATYKRAAKQLKRQLVEMNLFNAKLLYANKLLQNKNLTVKQQRAIVEALDNAKTLREAKLLYKSLSGSLARRGQGGKTLSESVRRTLGSSSRSTRSGSSTNNGVETDRWAVLAGIGK